MLASKFTGLVRNSPRLLNLPSLTRSSALLSAKSTRTPARSLHSLLRQPPSSLSKQTTLQSAAPRGQQWRGARWDQYTNADYGSKRGSSHGSNPNPGGFFSRLSPEALIYSIIGANGVVFLVWNSAQQRQKSFGDTKLLRWMVENFSATYINLTSGRVWTLLTPAFSHMEPMHLMINMFMLYTFGTDMARLLGPKRFLLFYLGAAAFGNLLSDVIRGIYLPAKTGNYRTAGQPAIGASTSVVGTTTLFACLYPHATLQLFFFVPVPAWLATVGFIGWDVYRVMRSDRTRVDGAGHLGGAAAALGYYWFRLRPLIRRMR
ncbi:hypothetical protein FBU59_002327 [Linderina macrospora]|uniref:Uncharacterized protein n=1 Tax=Linderina macrospora TaxID=4868 RepID=A0ACC1JBT7_9FUNG|nr:hypothetical protein FBU59_002327 [Linderina macrospora]